jgi:PPK2 family polyphosphate:nucleotide phosphotransferase
MKIDVKGLRVEEGENVSLSERPTSVDPVYDSKKEYASGIESQAAELNALHDRLYATGQYAVLVVLQGMDTSGKDGAVAHMMTGVNPQGCKVVSFKTPTPIEAKHDFLWRAVRALPERGSMAVYNRSYYEDVLITRVHPKILGDALAEAGSHSEFWAERYHSIRQFERHLTANATRIVKIFLHISKDEQRKRLMARLDDPEKTWKASRSDVEERKFWKDYRHAYEHALSETSVKASPWHIVPADDKKNARLMVSQIVIDALTSLSLETPKVDAARKQELKQIRAELEAE